MKTVSIQEAKITLTDLIERACAGEEILIARGKKPVVRLLPIRRPQRRKPGALRGKLRVGPKFFEPLPDEELAGWE